MSSTFIDEIVEKIENKSILTINRIDLMDFSYPQDYHLSEENPIPVVLFFEMFAQTAQVLWPGYEIQCIDYAKSQKSLISELLTNFHIYTYIELDQVHTNTVSIKGEIYYCVNESEKSEDKNSIISFKACLGKNNSSQQLSFLFPSLFSF